MHIYCMDFSEQVYTFERMLQPPVQSERAVESAKGKKTHIVEYRAVEASICYPLSPCLILCCVRTFVCFVWFFLLIIIVEGLFFQNVTGVTLAPLDSLRNPRSTAIQGSKLKTCKTVAKTRTTNIALHAQDKVWPTCTNDELCAKRSKG